MMMVDHRYHENLTPAQVDAILDAIAATDGGDVTGFNRAPAIDD
jgi:hypothetical protein